MKWKLILLVVSLCCSYQGVAQPEGGRYRISIFNESTSIPFTHFLNSPIHPGIQVGREFAWKEGPHTRLYPGVSIGYLFHRDLYQAVYVAFELGFDVKTDFGLNLKSALGLGYLHSFATGREYQLEDGMYVKGRDQGNARLMPSISVGLGYRLRPNDPASSEIFVQYQSWVEFPYSPGFIPLMTHTNLHLGFSFHP
ncbi:MAG: hypothetical protein R2824_15455 [Saprospiraceae bacterium]|nr:hypothetical protein [Lewinella sp.]